MPSSAPAMPSSAPSPNEWRCQNQNPSDGMWNVEWCSGANTWEGGAKANQASAGSSSSWWNSNWSNQAQPATSTSPTMYYVPMGFVVARAPTTQSTSMRQQAMIMHQYSSGASYAPSSEPRITKTPLKASAKAFTSANTAAFACSPFLQDSESGIDGGKQSGFESSDFVEGELPSVGSEGHKDGTCKRCAFFPKGRCKNGKDCTHCHYPHEPRPRLRRRAAARRAAGGDEVDEWDDQNPLEEEAEERSEVLGQESFQRDEEKDQVVKASGLEQPGKHDAAESETTEASVPAFSDSEEGTSFGCTDCDKVSMAEQNCSSSSDSELVSPTPQKSRKSSTLSSSPTSWAAQQRARKESDLTDSTKCEEVPATEIARMSRALLNKLTEERFEVITSQILALPFSTTAQLDAVAAEVFEKATTQDCFRSLYAELCTRLDTHLAAETSSVGGKAFRRALANECQATFERNLHPSEPAIPADLTDDEKLEAEIKLKERRLGNVRFIGELLVRRLLAPKLMPPIVHELMSGDASAIEDLIALLMVVAPSFEQKASIVQAPLKDAFAKLRRKSAEKNISSRLRYQICDLLEARERGWTQRAVA